MDGNKTFLQHANIKHYKSATHQEGTFTNNTTRQWQDKTAEKSEPTTIPPAKTRTYHCASGRQTDRQTDRQIKNQAPITAKHYSRGYYDLSRDAQTWIQKNWGTLKAANTLH